jgi:signal transduction histidine kinase
MIGWLRRLSRVSIRSRMTLGAAGAIIVTMSVFVFYEVREDRDYLIQEESKQALRLAHNLAAASGALVLAREYPVLEELARSFRLHSELDYLMLVALDGEVLAHSQADKVGSYVRDATSLGMLTGPPRARVLQRDEQGIDLAAPVRVADRVVGWSRVRFSLVHVRQGVEEAARRGVLFLAIGVAAGIIAALWSSRRLTARLYRLLATMERIRGGDRLVRAEIRGEDEIDRLAQSFNSMVDTLTDSERRAEQDELRLRLASKAGGVGLFDLDSRSGTLFLPGEWLASLGYAEGDLDNSVEAWEALVHPADRPHLVGLRQTLRDGAHRRDDAVVWHGVVLNVSESRRAADALRRSRDEVRELTRHQEVVREEEKARIAREIHDELGATLTALKMDAHWLERRTAALTPQHTAKLREMQALVDQAVQSTRRISTELRPRVIDDLGIVAALEWLVGEFRRQRGVDCRFAATPEHIDLDSARAITLFRIVQESLTNVAKHSGATRVVVDLHQEGDHIVLRIEDNGSGMKDRMANSEGRPFSHGLRGMIERAHQIGGSLSLGGGPQGGTVVAVRIPCSSAPQSAPAQAPGTQARPRRAQAG